MLKDMQSWYVFCIISNDSQVRNPLEGQWVKAGVERWDVGDGIGKAERQRVGGDDVKSAVGVSGRD